MLEKHPSIPSMLTTDKHIQCLAPTATYFPFETKTWYWMDKEILL